MLDRTKLNSIKQGFIKNPPLFKDLPRDLDLENAVHLYHESWLSLPIAEQTTSQVFYTLVEIANLNPSSSTQLGITAARYALIHILCSMYNNSGDLTHVKRAAELLTTISQHITETAKKQFSKTLTEVSRTYLDAIKKTNRPRAIYFDIRSELDALHQTHSSEMDRIYWYGAHIEFNLMTGPFTEEVTQKLMRVPASEAKPYSTAQFLLKKLAGEELKKPSKEPLELEGYLKITDPIATHIELAKRCISGTSMHYPDWAQAILLFTKAYQLAQEKMEFDMSMSLRNVQRSLDFFFNTYAFLKQTSAEKQKAILDAGLLLCEIHLQFYQQNNDISALAKATQKIEFLKSQLEFLSPQQKEQSAKCFITITKANIYEAAAQKKLETQRKENFDTLYEYIQDKNGLQKILNLAKSAPADFPFSDNFQLAINQWIENFVIPTLPSLTNRLAIFSYIAKQIYKQDHVITQYVKKQLIKIWHALHPTYVAESLCIQLNNAEIQACKIMTPDRSYNDLLKEQIRLRANVLFRLRHDHKEVAPFRKETNDFFNELPGHLKPVIQIIQKRAEAFDAIDAKNISELTMHAENDNLFALQYFFDQAVLKKHSDEALALSLKILILIQDLHFNETRNQAPIELLLPLKEKAYKYLSLWIDQEKDSEQKQFALFARSLANKPLNDIMQQSRVNTDSLILAVTDGRAKTFYLKGLSTIYKPTKLATELYPKIKEQYQTLMKGPTVRLSDHPSALHQTPRAASSVERKQEFKLR